MQERFFVLNMTNDKKWMFHKKFKSLFPFDTSR